MELRKPRSPDVYARLWRITQSTTQTLKRLIAASKRAAGFASESPQTYKAAIALSEIAAVWHSFDLQKADKVFEKAIQTVREFLHAGVAGAAIVEISLLMAKIGEDEKAFDAIALIEDPRPKASGYFHLAAYEFRQAHQGRM